jgi:hypothetical protein
MRRNIQSAPDALMRELEFSRAAEFIRYKLVNYALTKATRARNCH